MGKQLLLGLAVFSSACSQPQNLKFLDKLVDAGARDGGERCADAGHKSGAVCSVGQGACERAGTYVCEHKEVTCSATPGAPSDELCDTQRDEDCDGIVDEAPDGGCCKNTDCDELQECDRPQDDAFAAGSCASFTRPNADCKKDGEQVVCTCSAGYDGDGQTCVRNACVALENEDPPCGANQSCTPKKPGEKSCACGDGFSDCDEQAANGCEVTLATDPAHCGDCSRKCADGLGCVQGECEQRVKAISLGLYATLVLKTSGDVLGAGAVGLLHGQSSASSTLVALSLEKAKQVSVGVGHACLLRENGAVTCWGNNANYAIGSADKAATYQDLAVVGARAISAADAHSCMVSEQGRVYCWGSGGSGELGDGATRDSSFAGRTFAEATAGTAGLAVLYVEQAIDVHAGSDLNCALTEGKLVYCWGLDGSNAYAPELVRDAGGSTLADAVALSGGAHHACALRADGTVVCWGRGPLGSDTPAPPRNRYVAVSLSDVRAIASGAAHVCALVGDGTVRCWGENVRGQLGTGDTQRSPTLVPVLMQDLGSARALFAGGLSGGTCMELRTGRVYCWGFNATGQLGIGGSALAIPRPTEITAWP